MLSFITELLVEFWELKWKFGDQEAKGEERVNKNDRPLVSKKSFELMESFVFRSTTTTTTTTTNAIAYDDRKRNYLTAI